MFLPGLDFGFDVADAFLGEDPLDVNSGLQILVQPRIHFSDGVHGVFGVRLDFGCGESFI